jgi:hypothetical protein
MFAKRKIQLAAAAVVANGVLALIVLTPRTAYAACGLQQYCVSQAVCQSDALAFCLSREPQGCKFLFSSCSYPNHSDCGSNYLLSCQFTPI